MLHCNKVRLRAAQIVHANVEMLTHSATSLWIHGSGKRGLFDD